MIVIDFDADREGFTVSLDSDSVITVVGPEGEVTVPPLDLLQSHDLHEKRLSLRRFAGQPHVGEIDQGATGHRSALGNRTFFRCLAR